MKPNGTSHPKIQMLADALNINHAWALGITEHLLHFAMRSAPAGNVGKWSDQVIAAECKWPTKDARRLIRALLDVHRLDRHQKHRLLIHDWSEHAERSVHMYLARHNLLFADGRLPKMTGLSDDERTEILCTQGALSRAHAVRLRAREVPTQSTPRGHSDTVTVTDTDTVTDTVTPTQEKRIKRTLTLEHPKTNGNGQRPIEENLKPQKNGNLERDFTARTVDHIIKTCADSPRSIHWWTAVVTTLRNHPAGMTYLADRLEYIAKCADPKQRQLKDLGKLHKPGAYLTKQITLWAQKNHMRIPNTRKAKTS